MHQFERKWHLRRNDPLELERLDGAEKRRQIEALTPEINYPLDLDHAR